MSNERIPVTIITGFLGAGKTNLLNNLLVKHPEERFAIIENEFGETGIDGGLIKSTSEAIFELNNGCICCSLGDDFLQTLESLLGSSFQFDHLLIETTGIADPSAIVDAFVSGESIQQRFMIDSVVCVVDAVNFEDLYRSQPEVSLQLALADLVLVNKTDCVGSTYLHHLEKIIKPVNRMVRIGYTSFGNVNEIDVLDTNSFSGESIKKSALSFCSLDLNALKSVGNKSFIHNPLVDNVNKHGIVSIGFTFAGSFDVNRFGLWMQNYLYFNREEIFRVKGIVSFEGTDDQFIFHAVRSSFMFEVGKPWGAEPRFSRLVFIGKNLSGVELEANLLQLMAKS